MNSNTFQMNSSDKRGAFTKQHNSDFYMSFFFSFDL